MAKKKKTIRAKLIANPGSGTGADRGALLEQVTRCLQDEGIDVDVAVAKPKEKAIPIARQAVKDGYKVIIAMGGDDTIEAIIRGMTGSKAHTKARLGMIPVGTANNLAKSLGIPEDVEQACALIAAGKTRKIDMGQVKMKKGKTLAFSELVMVGIGAQLYPSALDASKGKNALTSIKDAVQKVVQHEAQPKITVKMDGESNVRVKSMLAIVSNWPLIGPNMLIDPNTVMDDGYFDVSLYPNFSKAELLAYTAQKAINKEKASAESGKIQRFRARKITIKSKPSLEVMADGIMLGKGKVKIKVVPGGLRVFAPPVGEGVEKPRDEIAAENLPAPVAPVETAAAAAEDKANVEKEVETTK